MSTLYSSRSFIYLSVTGLNRFGCLASCVLARRTIVLRVVDFPKVVSIASSLLPFFSPYIPLHQPWRQPLRSPFRPPVSHPHPHLTQSITSLCVSHFAPSPSPSATPTSPLFTPPLSPRPVNRHQCPSLQSPGSRTLSQTKAFEKIVAVGWKSTSKQSMNRPMVAGAPLLPGGRF